MKIKFLAAIMLTTLSACDRTPEQKQANARHRISVAVITCYEGLQYRRFDNVHGDAYSVVIDPKTDKPVHCTELPIEK